MDRVQRTEAFADEVMAGTRAFFARTNPAHQPSADMWAAMREIPRTVACVLEDKLDPKAERLSEDKFHICPLDAGIGKTTTLAQTIRAMRSHELYREHGVVLCFETLEQIRKAIQQIDPPNGEYAVYASDGSPEGKALCHMGMTSMRVNEAPVLFLTHKMVLSRSQPSAITDFVRRPWSEIGEFFYQDKARPAIFWDEHCPMGRPVVLQINQVGRVATAIERKYREASYELERLRANVFLQSLDNSAEGAQITLGDLYQGGANRHDVAQLLYQTGNGDIVHVSDDLFSISGQPVRMRRKGGPKQTAIVTCTVSLPDDFKPCFVFDACANVNASYRIRAEKHEDVSFLLGEGLKRYDHVTFHIMKGRSGRGGFKDGYRQRVKDIANGIAASPENSLVVYPKPRDKEGEDIDFHKLVKNQLSKVNRRKLHSTTWGLHTSSNEWYHCKNVFLASLYHFDRTTYEGLLRAAAQEAAEIGIKNSDIIEYGHTVVRDHLKQAVTRANMRVCDGPQAGECNVYLICSDDGLVRDMLQEDSMFPGCQINEWLPSPIYSMPSQAGETSLRLQGVLADWALTGKTQRITRQELIEAAGLTKQQGREAKDVFNQDGFKKKVARMGLSIGQRGRERYYEIDRNQRRSHHEANEIGIARATRNQLDRPVTAAAE